MLDEYLRRGDVSSFIDDILFNERYFQKKMNHIANTKSISENILALFIFYSALFQYKVIVDNIYLFDDFLEQLERLYRKIDNYNDLEVGIHHLIGRMVADNLQIKDVEDNDNRTMLLKYIYDKYIENGYYFHGFSSTYFNDLNKNSFQPEVYHNYYDRFEKINSIFSKVNSNIKIEKDFSKKEVYFTDDFVMGCYYSYYSPMFYTDFLLNFSKKDFYKYTECFKKLKVYLDSEFFTKEDKDFVLSLIEDERHLLKMNENEVSIMIVPRNEFNDNILSFDEYLNNDDNNYYDMVDRLLTSKSSKIIHMDEIEREKYDLYRFPISKKESSITEESEILKKDEIKKNNQIFLDEYGRVSILLVIGSLSILIGIVITIIKFVWR